MNRRDNLCPACGAMMYPARLLKGYDKSGRDAERPTCALHGPHGPFRHIATDRTKTEPQSARGGNRGGDMSASDLRKVSPYGR